MAERFQACREPMGIVEFVEHAHPAHQPRNVGRESGQHYALTLLRGTFDDLLERQRRASVHARHVVQIDDHNVVGGND